MLILGIETSCDETAASIVRDGVEIVSNVIASSQEMHKKTGGIIPEQAAREQIKCILPVIDEAMKGYKPDDIDAISVTYGPGLIGSLLVGIETAKTLAYVWKKPIVSVNHLIGHIYANFVNNFQFLNKNIEFSAMVLIVSGGHTELVLMKGHGDFQVVGQTRDDAAGEAFDKIARLLGLGYPGGPAIQQAATNFKSQNSNIKLPRPMINSGDLDFSFSGLKTAVLRMCHSEAQPNLPAGRQGIPKGSFANAQDDINYLAYEVQEAITDVLVKKTLEASKKYQVKTIMLAGGVAANKRLREALRLATLAQDKQKFILSIPPLQFCTDNAIGIASAGFFNYKPIDLEKIIVDPGLEIVSSL